MRRYRNNIRDVAEAAGVSVTTVSHVLNNRMPTRYAAATRDRVLKAVRKLSYTPNAGARAIGLRKFNTVGVLLSMDPRGSYLPQDLLRGLAAGLHQAGYRLNVMQLPDEAISTPTFIPSLHKEWQVDGLISNYTTLEQPQSWTELLEHHAVPVVYINCLGHYPVVRPDDFRAGQMAVEWLAAHGHRRIAYAGMLSAHYSAAERLRGWSEACRRLDLPVPKAWHRDAGRLNGAQWADALARLPAGERPTGVVFYGVGPYWQFTNRKHALGLDAPTCDVCLGSDQSFGPAGLQCVTTDWRAIGAKATRLLADIIAARARGDLAFEPLRETLQAPEWVGEASPGGADFKLQLARITRVKSTRRSA